MRLVEASGCGTTANETLGSIRHKVRSAERRNMAPGTPAMANIESLACGCHRKYGQKKNDDRQRNHTGKRSAAGVPSDVPELPDITVDREALTPQVVGCVLVRVVVDNAFVRRSVAPPLSELSGATVIAVERIGKRPVLVFEHERYLVVHLMIAGRLRWLARGTKPPGRTRAVAGARSW